MLKIGQNWGKIANYPPNAQQRSASLCPAHSTLLSLVTGQSKTHLNGFILGLNVLSNLVKEGSKSIFCPPRGCATVPNTAHTSFVLSNHLQSK